MGATLTGEEEEIIKPSWDALIPREEWHVYAGAISALRRAGIEFLIGGAFGLAAYTSRLRDTKDIDFFVLPEQSRAAMEALSNAGFSDYYPTLAYDRGWIYRSTRDGFIVDIIFQMANRRAAVDETWFAHGRPLLLKGERFKAVGPEELVWQKLYVLQRDRCDWPDILNLLSACASRLDWDDLRWRLGEDLPLLCGVLDVFRWLQPGESLLLPGWLREQLCQTEESPSASIRHRIDLLDSRAWHASTVDAQQFLEV